MTIQDIDILNPDIYVDDVPHRAFELLRREAPVFWHKEPGGAGFWAITRHDDVSAVLKDPQTFSSQLGGALLADLPEDDIRRSPDMLPIMDPPRHSRYRALVQQSFTTYGLSRSEARIKELVTAHLDRLAARDSFDFVSDFTKKLPMAVLLHMVGVPDEDQPKLMDWIHRLLLTEDPDFQTGDEERMALGPRLMEYAASLAAERRSSPRDDLLSVLMAAEVDGAKLTYQEFGMFLFILMAAGIDSPMILASTILTLSKNPGEAQRLRENPELLPSAIEETLRLHPPFTHFRRTARYDTEIRGQKIAAGQKVVTWMVSANRDEAVFDRPHAFDITRNPNPHLSFGHGPHFCLGNVLARRLANIGLTECFKRMPELQLAGPVERFRSNWLNGPKRMPVLVGPVSRN